MRLQHRIGEIKPGGFHIHHELRILDAWPTDRAPASTPILSAKISRPMIVAPRRNGRHRRRSPGKDRRPAPSPPSPMACSICMSSGLGLYLGKVKSSSLSIAITSAPMRRRASGAKAPAVPLPAGGDHLDGTRQLPAFGHFLQIGLAHVGHGDVSTAGAFLPHCRPAQSPSAASISSGPKVSGRCAPILTPVQPFSLWLAVTIATARTVQRELREIGYRRQRQADVVHLAAGAQQPQGQRLLDGERIGADSHGR